MKVILPLVLLCILAFPVIAQQNPTSSFMGVDISHLTVEEQTEVIQFFNENKEAASTIMSTTNTDIKQMLSDAEKYSIFGTKIISWFISTFVDTGMELDEYIKHSTIGKGALIGLFYYFAGQHILWTILSVCWFIMIYWGYKKILTLSIKRLYGHITLPFQVKSKKNEPFKTQQIETVQQYEFNGNYYDEVPDHFIVWGIFNLGFIIITFVSAAVLQ